MYKAYCRLYQQTFKLVSPLLPWRKPQLIEGENAVYKLPKVIKDLGIERVLIVTDEGITSFGLMDGLLENLKEENLEVAIYDKTVPNPTIDNIEDALQLYHAKQCEGIIAFGGGSPMDCAKGVGARIARPEKKVPQMKGELKVRKKIPPPLCHSNNSRYWK